MAEGLRVALTLDAEHPDRPPGLPDSAHRILDTLDREAVRSTVFMQGRWARAHPELARRIAQEGHLVGNHSNSHAPLSLLSDEGIRRDVSEAEGTITELTRSPARPWFRCPFGDGRNDSRVQGALSELGYRNVHWHVESADWEPWRSVDDVSADSISRSIRHGDGAVLLLHTWPRATVDALPIIIEELRRAGASFVTVDQLEVLP